NFLLNNDKNVISILKIKIDIMASQNVKVIKVVGGIIIMVIGILIIIGGMIAYNIEKANCPPELPSGCGPLTSAGGLGLIGVIALGGATIGLGLFLLIWAFRRS
ncbi:MAG: hypothetical protein ACFE9R_19055, partial [Candidatus Hermodarchaeota archaeon]